MAAKSESIIEVIQKMVQEGQPREKIIQSLSDLGVNDEQAKRLLLIAEADTLTLLRKEIKSLVKEEFLNKEKYFDETLHQDLKVIEEEEKFHTAQIARGELKDVRDSIIQESRGFEDRVNKVISDSQKTVTLVKVALDSLNNRLAQMELDVEQMKVHKFRKKSMFWSLAMLGVGAIVLLSVLFLLWMNFASIDVAQIVILSVLLLASITLMFASIIG